MVRHPGLEPWAGALPANGICHYVVSPLVEILLPLRVTKSKGLPLQIWANFRDIHLYEAVSINKLEAQEA